MLTTTNYQFKKIELKDSPPDITVINPNWDAIDTELKKVNEQLGEKVKYTDLTPITTTGTSLDYIATIPTNMTEVTIVPHINNLAGATLNGIPILDREGKPIEKDTLKANIPTKLVRVGSNFFIASGGRNLKLPQCINNTKTIIADLPNWFSSMVGASASITETMANAVVAYYNGFIYFIGNANYIYKFNLETGEYTQDYTSAIKKTWSYAVAINNNIYYGHGTDNTANFNIYDTSLKSNTSKKSPGTRRSNSVGCTDGNVIYINGGTDYDTLNQNMQVYDILTDTWTTKANSVYIYKKTGCAYSSITKKVYYVGGQDNSGNIQSNILGYDTITNTYSIEGSCGMPGTLVAVESIGEYIYYIIGKAKAKSGSDVGLGYLGRFNVIDKTQDKLGYIDGIPYNADSVSGQVLYSCTDGENMYASCANAYQGNIFKCITSM